MLMLVDLPSAVALGSQAARRPMDTAADPCCGVPAFRQDGRACWVSAMLARMVAHRLAGFDVTILYHDIRRVDMATQEIAARDAGDAG